VAGFRDFLARFRPATAPGRAAPGGVVPADRSDELAAELAPPLALLEQAEEEGRAVRERAEHAATRKRDEARRQAEEIVEAAHAEAARVRADSADRVRREAEAEAAAVLTEAERESDAVRERARDRMPALVGQVSALVARELGLRERERDREGGR
jgi:vacuolar-type H+-ATPase subunit H